MGGIKLLVSAFFLIIGSVTLKAQVASKGIITFERRTNLYKKIQDERFRKMIPEEEKVKSENFTLTFNDSLASFKYVQPETPEKMPWLTMKNAVYQNFKSGQRDVYYDFWGSSVLMHDSVVKREWKITDKTRKIAGYECTRAIWQKDDSTKIYAWFCIEIAPTIGPESVSGLPGAILGLATEDGGVVYFATKVELIEPKPENLVAEKKKIDEYNQEQFTTLLKEKMSGRGGMGDQFIREIFFW